MYSSDQNYSSLILHGEKDRFVETRCSQRPNLIYDFWTKSLLPQVFLGQNIFVNANGHSNSEHPNIWALPCKF